MHEVAIVETFELTSVAEAPALLPSSGRTGQNIQHGEVGEKLPERVLPPHWRRLA